MEPLHVSRVQARRFLLHAQLLAGARLPRGGESIRRVLDHLRAIQVDSIDVAGTNQDIALHSRIHNHRPEDLQRALYTDRSAFEYWLKCLCILPVEARSYYRFPMDRAAEHAESEFREHADAVDAVLAQIRDRGPQSSADFTDTRRTNRGWFGNDRLVKRLLERLWDAGVLAIHHRKRRIRFYDLADRCFPEASGTVSEEVYRRRAVLDVHRALRLTAPVGATAEVWRAVRDFRRPIQTSLLAEGALHTVRVHGSKREYLVLAEDRELLLDPPPVEDTVRLLAPLDTFLWDRKTIVELFSFRATFDVYKPAGQRPFGYYSLPVLFGERLVGRCDLARSVSSSVLRVLSVHQEDGIVASGHFEDALRAALEDHARFLGMDAVEMPA